MVYLTIYDYADLSEQVKSRANGSSYVNPLVIHTTIREHKCKLILSAFIDYYSDGSIKSLRPTWFEFHSFTTSGDEVANDFNIDSLKESVKGL